MFIIENGKIANAKTMDIGKIRIINILFQSDLDFLDNDTFTLVLGGTLLNNNFAFNNAGYVRFSYVDVDSVITSSSNNLTIKVYQGETLILDDTITITAIVDGAVLPLVTVTADKLLKNITAINTAGLTVTGTILNGTITTTLNNGLQVNVSDGYYANSSTTSFSASTITTNNSNVVISRGWLNQPQTIITSVETVKFYTLEKTGNMSWVWYDENNNILMSYAYYTGNYVDNVWGQKIVSTQQSEGTASRTVFSQAFYNATTLINAPNINTSSGKDFSDMFNGCTNLVSVPLYNMQNATNCNSMFQKCQQLKNITLNIPNVTKLNSTFTNSTRLETVNIITSSALTDCTSMFYTCTNLTTLSSMDCSGVQYISNMFFGCSKLANFGGLQGIKKSYDLSYSRNLTHDSLMNCINGLYDLTGDTSQTLTLGSTNLAKLTDLEKAIATNKNWVLA